MESGAWLADMRGATQYMVSALLAVGAVGCGSTGNSSTNGAGSSAHTLTSSSSASTGGSQASVGALSAEARSTATGDIPDNQVFLTFENAAAGYSISHPEGWARRGASSDVTFADKNNLVHIVMAKGAAPTPGSLQSELAALQQRNPTLKFSPPRTIALKSGMGVKSTYSTESAPNPVTGKRVLLVVDRYELARAGKRATVDLGTPKGVDNVDAYRLMINSFRWR